jgi:hypothetical protein
MALQLEVEAERLFEVSLWGMNHIRIMIIRSGDSGGRFACRGVCRAQITVSLCRVVSKRHAITSVKNMEGGQSLGHFN